LWVIELLPIFAEKQHTMPTIFVIFGFRFLFYSNDHSPIHVHVVKGGAKAKYNLFPVELIENQGFKPAELKLIESIIEENVETISEHWNTYFNNNK
jgi:hypothetical protein